MRTSASEAEPEAVELRGKVRNRDRDTSWEAAQLQTNGKTAELQIRLYELLLANGPKTDDELREQLRWASIPHTRSGVSTRRHELELAGWITAATDADGRVLKRRTDAGSPATVWRAVTDDEPAPEPRPEEGAPRRKLTPFQRLSAAQHHAMLTYGYEADDVAEIIAEYLNPGSHQ